LRSICLALSFVSTIVMSSVATVQAQNPLTSKFDHNVTRFPLTGTHVDVPCASCHLNGRYEATPTRCFNCHNGMTAPGAASLLGAHPKTTNYCEGCHLTTTWRDYRLIDHMQALGPCASCHDGKLALGKDSNPNHPITNAPCNVCHFNTSTWKGAILAPGAVTAATAATSSSRSGPAATSTTSPISSLRAGASTTPSIRSGLEGTTGRMNHAGTVANCARCHNNAVATGKPPRHLATNAPCETCHKSTVTFAGARVNHARLTGPCANCHNRVTAEGKPNGHLVTTASCETCHNTLLWTSVTYRHVSPAYVNHGPGVDCKSCHAGKTQAVAWKFPAFRSSCAGCHVDRYRPMQHVKFEKPVRTYYALSELNDCTGSCHVYADSTTRKVVQHNTSRHRPGRGGW
jgi:hypothetical protein